MLPSSMPFHSLDLDLNIALPKNNISDEKLHFTHYIMRIDIHKISAKLMIKIFDAVGDS